MNSTICDYDCLPDCDCEKLWAKRMEDIEFHYKEYVEMADRCRQLGMKWKPTMTMQEFIKSELCWFKSVVRANRDWEKRQKKWGGQY